MSGAIEQAKSFKDLLELGADGPYVFTQMFSEDGRRARSRSKRTFKLLKKVDAPLRQMLREGESVFYVTRGVAQPSILEWYLLGWPQYVMNQRAIVLTSHRVLLVQIDSRRNPREMRNEISYAAVKRLKNSWTGTTKVEFHSGGKVLLTGIPKAERKWLTETFEKLLSRLEAPPEQSELEHLCPHCYEHVSGHPPSCPSCTGHFKSPRRAWLLSLVYPGAGDFYLGHRGFAFLETAFATVLWVTVIGLALAPDVGVLESAMLAAFFLVFVHGGDAITTRMIARKGIIPDTGSSVRWRFAAAAVVPVVAIGTIAMTAQSKALLRPAPNVVSGVELRDAQVAALQDAGYLEPGETVQYFYSLGPVTILQDGSLFTNERIVAYESTLDGEFFQAARLEEVVDLHMEPAPPGASIAQVFVVTEAEGAFLLLLGTADGGDEVFLDELTDQWRAVRSTTPGVWFDGGEGIAPDDAILVHGVGDTVELGDAATWWFTTWFGEEKVDWTLEDRIDHDTSLEYRVGLPGEDPRTFFFALAR